MFNKSIKYFIKVKKTGSFSNCFEALASLFKALTALHIESLKNANPGEISWEWGEIGVLKEESE